MGLGQVALGVASIVMGVHHLRNGAKHLSGGTPSRRQQLAYFHHMQGLAGITAPVGMPAPHSIRVPGRAFMDSGRSDVLTHSYGRVPMRMRSFNIRTLDDRIRYLNRLADEGKRDPQVYAWARSAVNKKCGNQWCVAEKDNLGEARALFGAMRRGVPPNMTPRDIEAAGLVFRQIRNDVRYTSDIAGVDTYQKPAHTLALRSGDCDDYSSLTCSALGSLGIPCRYKVIRTKGAKDWNHIYAQAGFPRANPQRWISMDSSVNMPFGWEAPPRMVAASRTFRVR
jgi:hypothetical protein